MHQAPKALWGCHSWNIVRAEPDTAVFASIRFGPNEPSGPLRECGYRLGRKNGGTQAGSCDPSGPLARFQIVAPVFIRASTSNS